MLSFKRRCCSNTPKLFKHSTSS